MLMFVIYQEKVGKRFLDNFQTVKIQAIWSVWSAQCSLIDLHVPKEQEKH